MKFKLNIIIPLIFIIIFSVVVFYFQSQRSPQAVINNNIGNPNVEGKEIINITSTTCSILSSIPGIPTQVLIRMSAAGTANGRVGSKLELHLLADGYERNATPESKLDCGTWAIHDVDPSEYQGSKPSKICVREEGNPESTTWSVETGDTQATSKNLNKPDIVNPARAQASILWGEETIGDVPQIKQPFHCE